VHKKTATGWMWVMLGVLVVFNPLVPLRLGRGSWRLLDVAAVGVFVAAASMMHFSRREPIKR
jgi:hypothetical protein